MKKVLVVCQYYYPEPVRINDICEELVKKGYEVDVITDIPNYPMGEIYEKYKKKSIKDEIINGVHVHRCYTIPRKNNIFYRFLNYYSFAISSTLYVKKIKKQYDIVFVNQLSPVMMACAGIKYKKIHNVKLVMYCLDLWPESLKVGGIKEKSIIFKIFHWISNKIYRECDRILITSKSFKDYLKNEFSIKNEKIDYLPQYAESIFNVNDCKKEKNEKIDLLFAGNMGTTQSLDTIIIAAEKLENNKNLYWHFVGDGSEYERIKKLAEQKELKNVIFYGRKQLEEMPKYYKMADAMLVTLAGDSAVSNTLPGKVQSYMAAGKPIIGAINGETQDVINEARCGFCGEADNVDELVKNIEKFVDYDKKDELGENAYKYYENNFKKDIFIEKLISELENYSINNGKKEEYEVRSF